MPRPSNTLATTVDRLLVHLAEYITACGYAPDVSQAAILWLCFALLAEPPPPAETVPPPTPRDDAWSDVPVQSPSSDPAVPASPEPTASPEPIQPEPPAEPAVTPTRAACPCDPVDWRCWQAHDDVCRSDPPPPKPKPPTPAPAPTEAAVDTEDDAEPERTPTPPITYRFDSWQRRGVLVGLAAGVTGCAREWCDEFKVGGNGGFEAGYRFGIFAPVFAASIGGGRTGVSEELRQVGWDGADSSMRWIDVGIGVLIFPARNARVDPYVGARFGFSSFVQELSASDGFRQANATLRLGRAAVRFVAGLDFFVRPIFTLGPRFEISVPFGGKMCIRGDVEGFPDDRDCMKIRDLADDDGAAVPLDTSDLPLTWSLSLYGRFIFPRAPPPRP